MNDIDTKNIKFADTDAKLIISKDIINKIINDIKSNYDIDIEYKNYNFLNEKNLHILKENKNNYLFSSNSFGQKYLLYFTILNNKPYNIFINRKKKDLVFTNINFEKELYKNTMIDIELYRNNKSWIFIISDILVYNNINILDNILHSRIEILQNNVIPYLDKLNNISKYNFLIKKYYRLEYLEDIYNNHLFNLQYKSSGYYFQNIYDNMSAFIYIFPENRTKKSSDSNSNIDSKNFKISTHEGFVNIKQSIVEQNLIKKNIEINTEKSHVFTMKNTDLPDIYKLFIDNQEEMYAYAGIPNIKTSKFVDNMFNNETNIVKVKCQYSDKLEKWIPIKLIS